MKVVSILTLYGKNKRYHSCDYVLENNVKMYKNHHIDSMRRAGYTKDISFVEYPTGWETDEHGIGQIRACDYGLFARTVRVK